MNPTLFVNMFDIVEHTRLEKHQNMWSDMLEMDLIYILNDWN